LPWDFAGFYERVNPLVTKFCLEVKKDRPVPIQCSIREELHLREEVLSPSPQDCIVQGVEVASLAEGIRGRGRDVTARFRDHLLQLLR
jgi:hypothetical protein